MWAWTCLHPFLFWLIFTDRHESTLRLLWSTMRMICQNNTMQMTLKKNNQSRTHNNRIVTGYALRSFTIYPPGGFVPAKGGECSSIGILFETQSDPKNRMMHHCIPASHNHTLPKEMALGYANQEAHLRPFSSAGLRELNKGWRKSTRHGGLPLRHYYTWEHLMQIIYHILVCKLADSDILVVRRVCKW